MMKTFHSFSFSKSFTRASSLSLAHTMKSYNPNGAKEQNGAKSLRNCEQDEVEITRIKFFSPPDQGANIEQSVFHKIRDFVSGKILPFP